MSKHYLSEPEVSELNRIVVMFLDFAEDQARRRKEIFLRDWQTKLDDFLRFNDRNVLPNAGGWSRKSADDPRPALPPQPPISRLKQATMRVVGPPKPFFSADTNVASSQPCAPSSGFRSFEPNTSSQVSSSHKC